MIRVMTDEEEREHEAMLARTKAQMPPDVIQAIRTLRNWITLPEGWDEACERRDAVRWFIQEEKEWP